MIKELNMMIMIMLIIERVGVGASCSPAEEVVTLVAAQLATSSDA